MRFLSLDLPEEKTTVLLSYWEEHQLFKKISPLISFQIEQHHIVKFLGDIENASKYKHVVLIIQGSRVSTARHWAIIWEWLLWETGPLQALQIERPDIIELLVVFILSTKHNQLILIYNGTVAGPRLRDLIWVLPVGFQMFPLLSAEGVFVDLVGAHPGLTRETTEDDHGVGLV